jgi:hypothetical protein
MHEKKSTANIEVWKLMTGGKSTANIGHFEHMMSLENCWKSEVHQVFE